MDGALDVVVELCRAFRQVHIIAIADLWWVSRIQ